MNVPLDDLKARFAKLSTDDLLMILNTNSAQYSDVALSVAKEEVARRGVPYNQPSESLHNPTEIIAAESAKTKNMLFRILINVGCLILIAFIPLSEAKKEEVLAGAVLSSVIYWIVTAIRK